MSWTPPPEPLVWPLPVSIAHGGMTFTQIELRAPTGEDIMKATAIPGASNQEVTHRLIEAVSGVPFDAVKKAPWWLVKQMSDYMDEFAGAPVPGPLASWRATRAAALVSAPGEATAPAS